MTGSPTQFQVYDDDDFNSNDGATKDGDTGETLAALAATYSLMQESDNPTLNVFAPAYIMPKLDGGGAPANNGSVAPFVLNLDSSTEMTVTNRVSAGRNSGGAENNDYWVTYLQAGYQP